VDKSETDTLAVSSVQPIRIFCEAKTSSHHVSEASHVTATTITVDYVIVFVLQKLLKPTSFITAKSIASMQLWWATSDNGQHHTLVMRMLKVFFSVYSVYLWQNYSAPYWSGIYTTPLSVGFSGFMFTDNFFRTREKNDQIGNAPASCGQSLKYVSIQIYLMKEQTICFQTNKIEKKIHPIFIFSLGRFLL